MNNDETIKKLENEKRKRAIRNFEIVIVVMAILGIISPIFLLIFSIILMLVGVSAMYNIGDTIARLKFPISSALEEEKTKNTDKNWYIGAIISVIGFLLFLFTLYLMSIGWEGLIQI